MFLFTSLLYAPTMMYLIVYAPVTPVSSVCCALFTSSLCTYSSCYEVLTTCQPNPLPQLTCIQSSSLHLDVISSTYPMVMAPQGQVRGGSCLCHHTLFFIRTLYNRSSVIGVLLQVAVSKKSGLIMLMTLNLMPNTVHEIQQVIRNVNRMLLNLE